MSLKTEHNVIEASVSVRATCDSPRCSCVPFEEIIYLTDIDGPATSSEKIQQRAEAMALHAGFRRVDGRLLCVPCMSVQQVSGRPDWDSYFMVAAYTAATRATCNRKHVGCVIVRDRNVVATGYNGSIEGMADCDTNGHLMVNNHCIRTIHAEQNAIAQAAKHGHAIKGSTIYITAFPCWPCAKISMNAGITRIVYDEAYKPDPFVIEHAGQKGVNLIQANPEQLLKAVADMFQTIKEVKRT